MKHLTRKAVIAYAVMFLLFFPVSIGLTYGGMGFFIGRELTYASYKAEAVSRMNNLLEAEADASEMWMQENLKNLVLFMSGTLKEFVKNGKYTGPRMFEDGMVVELRGDEVIYPEEMPEGYVTLSREIIEESSGEGYLFKNSVRVYPEKETAGDPEEGGEETEEAGADEGNGGDETDEKTENIMVVTSGRITEDVYYVDLTSWSEAFSYLELHGDAGESIEAAEKAYGGAFLYINNEEEEDLPLTYKSSYFEGITTAAEAGITKEILEEEEPLIEHDGETYFCVYKKNAYRTLVFMKPIAGLLTGSTVLSVFVCLVLLFFYLTFGTYAISVQRFVKDRILSGDNMVKYRPSRLRRTLAAAGAVGAVLVFLAAVMIHLLGVLHTDTVSGKETLNILIEQLEKTEESRTEAAVAEESDWYVYYGNRIVSLISRYPQLKTKENLQRFCDVLSIDYIMLFDADGHETMSSNEYSGFRLGTGQGEHGNDFRRLLLGVPEIVQEASLDETTGLERQFIGVTMPTGSESEKNGALIMALMPDRTRRTRSGFNFNELLGMATFAGSLSFAADADTGKIIYANDASLTGKNITECGLSDKSLRDGYMDFVYLNGEQWYVMTRSKDPYIYYYADETADMFGNAVPYGLMVAACYAVVLLIFLLILLKGYTQEEFEKWAVEGQPVINGSVVEYISHDGRIRKTVDPSKRWLFMPSVWKDLYPEQRSSAVAKGALALLVLSIYVFERHIARNVELYDNSILDFILRGNWMRGFNLFSVCAILSVLAIAFVTIFICRQFLRMTGSFLNSKGETVCRLVLSFIEYIAVLIVCYYIFEYLGFPANAWIASLGLVSLALSLGAKDFVADILAGISIVFEGEFQVGDIVDIGGYRGTVQEIGVRSTKVIGRGDNIKIIDNRDIKNVINMTRLNSWYPMELKVDISQSLSGIEKMLSEELPVIGEAYDVIISGPVYKGVVNLGNGTMTLSLITECKEQDFFQVERILNREMRLLFEKRGIKLL